MFYFHGIMIGPLTFYKDYIAFIDGTSLVKPGSTYVSFIVLPYENVDVRVDG